MITGNSTRLGSTPYLDVSIQERLTDDAWQSLRNRRAGLSRNKAPCPGILFYPENLAEQFHFSFCPMSPCNKSCDLTWPERFCACHLQPENQLNQLQENAKWLSSIHTRWFSTCHPQLVTADAEGKTCILDAGNRENMGHAGPPQRLPPTSSCHLPPPT